MKLKRLYMILFTILAFVIAFSGVSSANASKWHKGIPTYLNGRYGRMQAGTQKGAYLYSLKWYQKDSTGVYNEDYLLNFDSFPKDAADTWGQSLDTNTFNSLARSNYLAGNTSSFIGKNCKWKKTRYGYYINSKSSQGDTLKIKVIKNGLNHMRITEYSEYQDKYVKVLDNSSFKRSKKINHLI